MKPVMKQTNFSARAVGTLSVLAICALSPIGPTWADIGPILATDDRSGTFTRDFRIEDCTFSDTGRNPYFSLNPGDSLTLAGRGVDLQITVLNETQVISFVTAKGVRMDVLTRVVEERESENGSLIEVSRNFFARCQETNDIHYFGESVDIFEAGGISHEGSWLAGIDGALPGLIMPGTFLLGSRYFQEQAPGVALDRAEHVAMGLTITVPAGTFEGCVKVLETTRLDRSAKSTKKYCPGIGLVFDDGVELVSFSPAPYNSTIRFG
jgi:hypothetical protein